MRYRLLSLGRAGVVEDGGSSIEFPVGKPFGILAYLSLASDPIPRDELAAVFWSDGDRSRARHSLRQALSFLRQQLGEDVFASDDPVALDPEVLDSDVSQLRAALESGDVDRVLELYRGPFLETFQLTSSPAWDHWLEIQRRILEERVAVALREAAEDAGSPERSVELLRRVVEIEPHRVEHRRALLERLLGQGDVEGATAVLAEARQADVDDPSPLEELEGQIRAVRENRRGNGGDGSELYPEFVGRTAELASLTASWRAAIRGRRQIAIVSGPTGIGKTRLAEELAAVAEGTGRVVHVKASSVERRLDWSVTAELARSLYRLPGAAGVGSGSVNVLRSLVPSLGGTATPSPTIAPRPVAVSDALVDLVGAVAYEAPLLIVLDDMQWVDRASLGLLLRMTRQIRDEPVMVVLTFRSEELASREYSAIGSLVEEENASVLRLHTLTEPEVQELLMLSGIQASPDRLEDLAGRLHDVTRGHPLFLVELLRSLRDDGTLVRDDDGWRFQDPEPVELELPVSVRLVIDRRLERLSDDARALGTVLAGLPPNAGLERVRSRTGLSDAAFTAALNELLDRAVVSWDPGGRLVFTHDQLREAMVERRRPRVPAGKIIAAAFVILVAALTPFVLGGEAAAERWGGGMIIVPDADSLLAVDPSEPPVRWSFRPAQVWRPEMIADQGGYRFFVRRLTDNRVVWFGSLYDTIEAPRAAVFWGPDEWTERSWQGDDNIRDVSPDGRYLVWATEHHGGEQYAKELRVVETESDSVWLITGPASGMYVRWSPDGRRIALSLGLARDSLLIITPTGERLFARSFYQARIEDWCGPERVLVVVREEPTDVRRRLLVDPSDTALSVLDSVPMFGAQCSPDGTAYVSRTILGGAARLTVTDLETGSRYPLPARGTTPTRVFWLPDSVPPIPDALVVPDTIRLTRGGSKYMTGQVQLTDGSLVGDVVSWKSTDPAIASVVADSIVAANRPGETRIVAEYANWLTDTVVVRVMDGGQESLIESDDFRSVDTNRWFLIGRPEPDIARVDGRTVLELRGDGRYSDGLISKTAAATPAGFTVEFEFQAPSTAPEYQRFWVTVAPAEPPSDTVAWHHLSSWIHGDQLVFSVPAFELDKWSPELVAFRTGAGLETIGVLPRGTNLATWTHGALQIRADGLATLWIDRQQVASLRMPAVFLQDPMRVGIFGATHDTYAYVRNFAWWAEPRYR